VTTVEEALQGARDIVAETISDNANVRSVTREKALKFAKVTAEKVEDAVDEKRVYESYYAFDGRVDRLQPHQVLALNRGEKEGVLKVRVEMDERDWHEAIAAEFQEDILSPFSDQLSLAIEDSAVRLLLPAIERDVRRELGEKADGHAINVFATNLRALLSQPPLAGQTVLGLDPGFRTGTKVAVVDPTGKLLDTGTIYPHEPKNDWIGALTTLEDMVNRHHVTLITIGNGTASRETEKLVAELIRVGADGSRSIPERGRPPLQLARFHFPRQPNDEHLCLADYFAPVESGKMDVVVFQVVTVGQAATERFDKFQSEGNYSEGYFTHGLAVQTAEATAEYLHRHVRRELGIPEGQGKRYSWGYPAIPELEDHHKVFDLLPVEKELGMQLSPAYQLIPEQSTAAIIVHHPQAKYYTTGESRVEQLMR
jgi:hypothetical protein